MNKKNTNKRENEKIMHNNVKNSLTLHEKSI